MREDLAYVLAAYRAEGQREVFERCQRIVTEQIVGSTGPTGGWLDSPKAINAAILLALKLEFSKPGEGQS
jgi:hypothetical protein